MVGDKARIRAVYVDSADTDLHGGPALLEAAGFTVTTSVVRTSEDVVAAAEGATALLVGDAPVTEDVFVATPELRIVATVTVGFDHIDLAAARRQGVWVTNVPGAATEEVAVHALAMALSLLRHLPGFDRHVRAGGWDVTATGRLRRPSSQTLGLIGLGRIGSKLAELARPVFGSIVGHDPKVPPHLWPAGVARAGLDAVFEVADVVSLHLPLTNETSGLVDRRRLALMKRGSLLVNVSRGGLVDPVALVEALDAGRLAGAGLDVLPVEPPRAGDPLLGHPQILLSPHAAFLSVVSDREYCLRQAENVVAWRTTGRPVTPVLAGPTPSV